MAVRRLPGGGHVPPASRHCGPSSPSLLPTSSHFRGRWATLLLVGLPDSMGSSHPRPAVTRTGTVTLILSPKSPSVLSSPQLSQ